MPELPRPKVFVTRALPEPEIAPLLEAGLDVTYRQLDSSPARSELLDGVAEADALLCMLTEQVDAELLDAAPRLRIVANLAVGFDNVDVAAATERGVLVTTTPGVLTEATADLAWTLILATARRVAEADRFARSGEWKAWSGLALLGSPVAGQTLGIVGLGAIGTAVARRARGFDMPVLYTNRHRNLEAERTLAEAGAAAPQLVPLDELLERADIVSLHAPLNADSRHLIDADALARMKPTAILVNTARGPLVDEPALVAALRDGTIAAAGLDVFEHEPALAAGLAELPNTVLLPHIGSATRDTRAAMVRLCCDNIVAVLSGHPPLTARNPEVIDQPGT
ncbi:MAG: 2-hydroxyacid dehydrogenase [Acidimicrobiales bacterium]